MSKILSTVNFYILLSLSDQERHGYDIMKQVKKDSLKSVVLGPGTLYGALKRLNEAGLIKEVERQESKGGRIRKYYRLTDSGSAELADQQKQAQQMLKASRDAQKRVGKQAHAYS